MGTGDRGKVGSQSRLVGNCGERRGPGGGSQSISVDVGGHSGERRGGVAAVTRARCGHLAREAVAVTHNRCFVEAPS